MSNQFSHTHIWLSTITHKKSCSSIQKTLHQHGWYKLPTSERYSLDSRPIPCSTVSHPQVAWKMLIFWISKPTLLFRTIRCPVAILFTITSENWGKYKILVASIPIYPYSKCIRIQHIYIYTPYIYTVFSNTIPIYIYIESLYFAPDRDHLALSKLFLSHITVVFTTLRAPGSSQVDPHLALSTTPFLTPTAFCCHLVFFIKCWLVLTKKNSIFRSSKVVVFMSHIRSLDCINPIVSNSSVLSWPIKMTLFRTATWLKET